MNDAARPWQVEPGGLTLTVRLTAKGGRDDIDGLATQADGRCVLKVRVRAAPRGGEANAALIALPAKALATAQGAIRLVAGDTARIKRLQIKGTGAALAATLEKIVAGSV